MTCSDRLQAFPVADSKLLFAHLLEGDPATRDARLAEYFGSVHGGLAQVDLTDGIRMTMVDGIVVHLRASGNAPELRCYTEAEDVVTASAANSLALQAVVDQVMAIARRA